jgi:hypothetical protein
MSEVYHSRKGERYSNDELQARLKFVIGIILALILGGIVFVVLYSLIFVTQPLGMSAPNDEKFFSLITPLATFLTGTLSGIMLAGSKPDMVDTPPATPAPTQQASEPEAM